MMDGWMDGVASEMVLLRLTKKKDVNAVLIYPVSLVNF